MRKAKAAAGPTVLGENMETSMTCAIIKSKPRIDTTCVRCNERLNPTDRMDPSP